MSDQRKSRDWRDYLASRIQSKVDWMQKSTSSAARFYLPMAELMLKLIADAKSGDEDVRQLANVVYGVLDSPPIRELLYFHSNAQRNRFRGYAEAMNAIRSTNEWQTHIGSVTGWSTGTRQQSAETTQTETVSPDELQQAQQLLLNMLKSVQGGA